MPAALGRRPARWWLSTPPAGVWLRTTEAEAAAALGRRCLRGVAAAAAAAAGEAVVNVAQAAVSTRCCIKAFANSWIALTGRRSAAAAPGQAVLASAATVGVGTVQGGVRRTRGEAALGGKTVVPGGGGRGSADPTWGLDLRSVRVLPELRAPPRLLQMQARAFPACEWRGCRHRPH